MFGIDVERAPARGARLVGEIDLALQQVVDARIAALRNFVLGRCGNELHQRTSSLREVILRRCMAAANDAARKLTKKYKAQLDHLPKDMLLTETRCHQLGWQSCGESTIKMHDGTIYTRNLVQPFPLYPIGSQKVTRLIQAHSAGRAVVLWQAHRFVSDAAGFTQEALTRLRVHPEMVGLNQCITKLVEEAEQARQEYIQRNAQVISDAAADSEAALSRHCANTLQHVQEQAVRLNTAVDALTTVVNLMLKKREERTTREALGTVRHLEYYDFSTRRTAIEARQELQAAKNCFLAAYRELGGHPDLSCTPGNQWFQYKHLKS